MLRTACSIVGGDVWAVGGATLGWGWAEHGVDAVAGLALNEDGCESAASVWVVVALSSSASRGLRGVDVDGGRCVPSGKEA